jgi:predicted nucleotidyltransferase
MRIEESQRQAIADICTRYRVRKLSLFGSAAMGTERPDSDVDLLVEFTPGQAPTGFDLVHMRDELQRVFQGRKIDLAFPSILHNAWRRSAIEPQLQTVFQ